jgi:hypothetical protein
LDSRDRVILDENARESLYDQVLEDKRKPLNAAAVAVSRNTAFTGTASSLRGYDGPPGRFFGRVKLDDGRDFYIGPGKATVDDGCGGQREVYSWNAPVADTLYLTTEMDRPAPKGARPTEPHKWCDRVIGTRTFADHETPGEIPDYEDTQIRDVPPAGLFPLGETRVPRPPASGDVPGSSPTGLPGADASPAGGSAASPLSSVPAPSAPALAEAAGFDDTEAPAASEPKGPAVRHRGEKGALAPSRELAGAEPAEADEGPSVASSPLSEAAEAAEASADAGRAAAEPDGPDAPDGEPPSPVRVERLVRGELERPREQSLKPVLATLQPDQYRIVSSPVGSSLIVDGPPGSGKTIIAAHRAAYLVLADDSRFGEDRRVLVVGPTQAYCAHIRGVVDGLVGPEARERIVILDLPGILARCSRIKAWPDGRLAYGEQDVDEKLCDLIDLACEDPWESPDGDARARVAEAYGRLRRLGDSTLDGDTWREYFRALPVSVNTLAQSPRHIPVLAYLTWKAGVRPTSDALLGVTHVVVDEAQDLTALEWRLLRAISGGSGHWTIVGDPNQRRSEGTAGGWRRTRRLIGLRGMEFFNLRRAFRSTGPILEFAGRLLRASAAKALPFQEGDEVRIQRVAKGELAAKALDEALAMRQTYPKGMVAVITADPEAVRLRLSRLGGWQTAQTGDGLHWERPDEAGLLTVGAPDDVRGLEFDAAVVVEPAVLRPRGVGAGALYTALTRANRELSVVHSRELPIKLRS